MKKHITLITLSLCLIEPSIARQTTTLAIAVNDLAGTGVDKSVAEIISERLRSELLNTKVFRVMERKDMSSVLKEQGFQQTGACDEASCLVEVGQLLGVDRMVAGTIGKIEDMYTLTLRMINVANGEILYTVNEDITGDISGVLTTAVNTIALKLAERAGKELSNAATDGKKSDLYIESAPAGATIELDGTHVEGITPVTLQGIPAGKHRITLRLNDYYGTESVELLPDDLLKVNIVMVHGKGSLRVFSDPEGASVTVNSLNTETTPCKFDDLPTGRYQVTVEKEGYLPETDSVAVHFEEISTMSVTLKPAGSISINSNPTGAEVLINRQRMGVTPYTNSRMEPGDILLTLTLDTYKPIEEQISIPKDTTVVKTYKLLHTSVFLDSVKAENAERRKRNQWVRRIMSGMGAAITFGLGVYYETRTADALQTYKAARSYNPSVHDDNWNEYESNKTRRNVLYGVAGALGAVFVLSIPL